MKIFNLDFWLFGVNKRLIVTEGGDFAIQKYCDPSGNGFLRWVTMKDVDQGIVDRLAKDAKDLNLQPKIDRYTEESTIEFNRQLEMNYRRYLEEAAKYRQEQRQAQFLARYNAIGD